MRILLLLGAVVVLAAALLLLAPADRTEEAAGLAATPAPAAPAMAPGGAVAPAPIDAGGAAAATGARVEVGSGDAALLLRLIVLEPEGGPAPGAELALFRGGEIFVHETTGAAGAVELDAPGGSARALVLAPGHAPLLAEVLADPGEFRLQLTGGAAVAGQILVDGLPPRTPVALELRSDPPAIAAGAIPVAVQAAMGFRYTKRPPARAETGAAGRFQFRGLPEDWRGALRSREKHLVPADREVEILDRPWIFLDAPREDLLVRLRSLPVLRGRIVQAGTGEPWTDGNVMHRASLGPPPGDRDSWSIALEEDGSFQSPVPGPEIHNLVVRLQSAKRPHHDWIFAEVPPDLDLGVLELPDFRLVGFQVFDAAGRPVAGARASVGENWARSEPTDAEGLGVANGPQETFQLRVNAAGYLSATVPVQRQAPEPVTVLLERTNELRVRLLQAGGEPPDGWLVQLRAAGRLFNGMQGLRFATHRIQKGYQKSAMWGGGRESIDISPDKAGLVWVSGLDPSSTIRLRVKQDGGTPFIDEELPAMPETGIVERSYEVPAIGARAFAGVVLGAGARPLENANLQISHGVEYLSARTDPWGHFQFAAVPDKTVSLTIRAEGHVKYENQKFAFPPAGQPAEFRLQPGLTVEVRVVDAAGNPVESWGWAKTEGFPDNYAKEINSGTLRFSMLPPVKTSISISAAGREFTREHDPYLPELRIEIPATGLIQLETAGIEFEQDGWYRFLLEEAGGSEVEFSLTEDDLAVLPRALGRAFPGQYEAFIMAWNESASEEDRGWRTLAGPLPCTVQAGGTTSLLFQP